MGYESIYHLGRTGTLGPGTGSKIIAAHCHAQWTKTGRRVEERLRYRTIALCIAAMTALGAMTAEAQSYVNIIVANGVVARIRTAGQYGSIYEREAKINQRITEALGAELASIFPRGGNAARMSVSQMNGRWTLSVGSTWLIQAYPEDAAGAGTNTKALIMQWKENFARRLPMAVSPSKVPSWWTGPTAADAEPSEPQPSGLPAADDPLVDALVREMSRIRAMSEQEFDARKGALEAGILAMVCNYRQPEGFPNPPTSLARVKNLFIVLRGAGMSDAKFAINKRMYAGQTIKKIREEFDVPAGRGPIPTAAEVLLPEVSAPTTPTMPTTPTTPTDPRAIPAPRIVAGTPIAQAVLGTGLDPNNHLLNPGQQFAADAPMVMLYLQVCNAPNNTIVGVTMRMADKIIGKRMLNLCGDRTLAVSFYPQTADRFTPGDYVCEIAIGEQVAASIPFRVGAM